MIYEQLGAIRRSRPLPLGVYYGPCQFGRFKMQNLKYQLLLTPFLHCSHSIHSQLVPIN